MKRCPFCAEEIQGAALVCRYCQRDLPRTSSADVEAVATPPVSSKPTSNLKLVGPIAIAVGFGMSAFMSSVGPGIFVMWVGFGLLLPGSAGFKFGGGLILSIVLGMLGLSFATNDAQSRAASQQREQATEQQRQAGQRAESILAETKQAMAAKQWREAAKLNLEIGTLNPSLPGRAEAEKLIQEHVRVLDVADGLNEAARVASDVQQREQPTAIASAWAKLKQARPTDASWHAASAAAGSLEVCRKSTERQLSAGLQKMMMAQREAWSQKTDTIFLDNGMNVAISLAGATKDRATLKWALMSRADAHKLTDGGSMKPTSFLGGLQKIGFKRVTFTDGYDESWSYTLEPENETKAGTMVLAHHGLGEPLALTR